MRTPIFVALVIATAGVVPAAPTPPTARALVAGLSDPSPKVRDEAAVALVNRPDAAPWLRRAAGSGDQDTARRARGLLTGFATKRQAAVPAAIDACIRNGQIDLLIEWHHYWQPESRDELWPVGPRAARAGVELHAKRCDTGEGTALKGGLTRRYARPAGRFRVLDGPFQVMEGEGPWLARTDRIVAPSSSEIAFASVRGGINLYHYRCSYLFALGEIAAISGIEQAVLIADSGIGGYHPRHEPLRGPTRIEHSFVACRGNVTAPVAAVVRCVLLVEGDIDLSMSSELENSVIRASGAIHLRPGYKPVNCSIEAHAKNATAPYTFFELSDVGLDVVDDEEGMVVADLKPDTPFGSSGARKGDIILAIDDAPAGHSSQFRKSVRRAMVRQGNCLLTVARGRETLDFAVLFPLPK